MTSEKGPTWTLQYGFESPSAGARMKALNPFFRTWSSSFCASASLRTAAICQLMIVVGAGEGFSTALAAAPGFSFGVSTDGGSGTGTGLKGAANVESSLLES